MQKKSKTIFLNLSVIALLSACAMKNDRKMASVDDLERITENHILPDNYCFRFEAGLNQDRHQGYLEGNQTGFSLMGQFRRLENGEKRFDGFEISSRYYGEKRKQVDAGVESEKDFVFPNRAYGFDFEGRGNFISFSVVDMPVKEIFKMVSVNGKAQKQLKERYESTSIRITNYNFFPRNYIPNYLVENGEVKVYLPTGEEATFDQATGRVKDGVFSEEVSSTYIKQGANSNLIFPNKTFSYTGKGIWIESRITGAADEREPGHKVKIKTLNGQKIQSCEIKSEEVFKFCNGYRLPPEDPKYSSSKYSCVKIKFDKDDDFYEFVKKRCPTMVIQKF